MSRVKAGRTQATPGKTFWVETEREEWGCRGPKGFRWLGRIGCMIPSPVCGYVYCVSPSTRIFSDGQGGACLYEKKDR